MDPSEWIRSFKLVHEKAKKGLLTDDERPTYDALREELARSLIAAQRLSVPDGSRARQHFRVAQLWPVEIDKLPAGMTRDVSRAGFSSVQQKDYETGRMVDFVIKVSSSEKVTGRARVVTSLRQVSGYRVSFAVTLLNPGDSDRLETALFDAVLSRMA